MVFLLSLVSGLVVLAPVLTNGATLENPGYGAKLSGIGLISGWKCEGGSLTVRLNGGSPISLVYGGPRGDTAGVCGDSNNGFAIAFNWALLGDGTHTAVAYDNGVEFARSVFTVTTLGEEFVRGASVPYRIFLRQERTQRLSGVSLPRIWCLAAAAAVRITAAAVRITATVVRITAASTP